MGGSLDKGRVKLFLKGNEGNLPAFLKGDRGGLLLLRFALGFGLLAMAINH